MNYTIKMAKYLERTLKEFKKETTAMNIDYFDETFYSLVDECIDGLALIHQPINKELYKFEYVAMFDGEFYNLIPDNIEEFNLYQQAMTERQQKIDRALDVFKAIMPELWVDVEQYELT